jgi:hypothetical protein
MLKELALITITVSNLGQVESSWQQNFGYEVLDRGQVSEELAGYWQAEEMSGRPYMLMRPANAAPVYIRFVEDEAVEDYRPMTSTGWNATELLVRDTDLVAERLRDSAFEIVGEPKDLWPAPDAPRAMQAVGPGKELLYLTTNNQAADALGLDESMPLVERPFIMVLGGSSMSELTQFYGGTLGLRVDPPSLFKITMISKANKLDIETTYPLAVAYLAPGYLIELDEMPDAVKPRPIEAGHLPPGIAVVGFTADDTAAAVDWVSRPRVINAAPYDGRRAGLIRGPAGELVEIILPREPDAGDARPAVGNETLPDSK